MTTQWAGSVFTNGVPYNFAAVAGYRMLNDRYIESQKWDDPGENFKITAPAEP